MLNSGIYKILNRVNGKFYIGSAIHFNKRWAHHKSDLRLKRHGSITLQRAWDLHGEAAFEFIVLESGIAKDKLIGREQFHLDWLTPSNPDIGYNINPIAGSRLGTKHTAEFKAKRSAMMTGKKQCPKIVAKRAASNTGKKRSAETKKRMSDAQRNHAGLTHTEEAKLRIGKASKERRARETDLLFANSTVLVAW